MMPKSGCMLAVKKCDMGLTNFSVLKALILMASAFTPSSPNVLPSAAYIEVQSNETPSGLFMSLLLMAVAVAAAMSSSVMSVVQFMVGDISLAERD